MNFNPFKNKAKAVKKPTQRRQYSAAKIDRLTSSWHTTQQSINRDLQAGGKLLRARARDLSINNDYARKYLQLVVSNVVGSNGIGLQVKSKTAKGKLNVKANRLVEQGWKDWTNARNCAWDSRLSFVEMQRLFIESAARDGEVLVRLINDDSKFGFKLQFLDVNRLDEHLNKDLGNGAIIKMGIEFDITGKPVAYHLAKTLDVQLSAGLRTERIPAENIIHAFIGERPEQIRGASWMASAMSRLQMLGAYEEAELVAARVGACKMGFYTSEAGDSFVGEEDDQGNLITEAEAGIFEQLPAGTSFTSFDPTHPTSAFKDFNKAILRGIASGLGVAYNSLSSDLEGVSYSSIRSGTIEERDQWKVKQNWMVAHFMQPIYEKWLAMQLLTNTVGQDMTNLDALMDIRWQAKSWNWVDPLKDIQANIAAINAGIKTSSEVIAEQGGDIEDVYDQLAYEQELAKEKGLFLGEVSKEGASNEQSEEVTDG
jgi:lambda family phage portal protein